MSNWFANLHEWTVGLARRQQIGALPITIALSCVIGILGGLGSVVFLELIHAVRHISVDQVFPWTNGWLAVVLCLVPAIGLLVVAFLTRVFAPEAQGHGVPEVIMAVARNDGVIRPRVSLIKILASGLTIGSGGSVGREGPIVQIGASIGSACGQIFKLPPQHLKVLVAAGGAAGISATFNAPLAGVIFASEVILGNFAVESLTPIVIASVLAAVVQIHLGEHGLSPAFEDLGYEYLGAWEQLPSQIVLGLLCGVAAVYFIKLLYATEDISQKLIRSWWLRAILCGTILGVSGLVYPSTPPEPRSAPDVQEEREMPPLFGVGYPVVEHAIGMTTSEGEDAGSNGPKLDRPAMWRQLLWLLPLVFLKPIMTSLTLGGGGSGGIFAPSLFLGATLGGCFGLAYNLMFPGANVEPGIYAIVGMGAVVAGTTHGVLSAILIVYEMTGDYKIILPIMIAAGLSSVVARFIDPESIYHKKLSRRGISLSRGHHAHRLEHVKVQDVMIRRFPTVRVTDDLNQIVAIARANATFDSLPVVNDQGQFVGIIRPEDLHRVLDTDIKANLVFAEDITFQTAVSVLPDENLLEAMSDFGTIDVETLPVEVGKGESRRLVGLLLRSDVMQRYRKEMLQPL